jgi:hypothetical protein
VIAHLAGSPVEEFVPVIGGIGAGLLLARAWVASHVARPNDRHADDVPRLETRDVQGRTR